LYIFFLKVLQDFDFPFQKRKILIFTFISQKHKFFVNNFSFFSSAMLDEHGFEFIERCINVIEEKGVFIIFCSI